VFKSCSNPKIRGLIEYQNGIELLIAWVHRRFLLKSLVAAEIMYYPLSKREEVIN